MYNIRFYAQTMQEASISHDAGLKPPACSGQETNGVHQRRGFIMTFQWNVVHKTTP